MAQSFLTDSENKRVHNSVDTLYSISSVCHLGICVSFGFHGLLCQLFLISFQKKLGRSATVSGEDDVAAKDESPGMLTSGAKPPGGGGKRGKKGGSKKK